MPIYEYTCGGCGQTFDHLQRTMSDAPRAAPKCPDCGSAKTARALSLFAVGADAGPKPSPMSGPGSCGRCGNAPGSCGMG